MSCKFPNSTGLLWIVDVVRRLGDLTFQACVLTSAGLKVGGLREWCAVMPDFSTWLKGVEDRVVDLLDPFKCFAYYHPAQGGSASMKAVLPALTGKGYEGLAIREGGAAIWEFLRVTLDEVPEDERQRVRRQLEDYCGHDLDCGWPAETRRLRAFPRTESRGTLQGASCPAAQP